MKDNSTNKSLLNYGIETTYNIGKRIKKKIAAFYDTVKKNKAQSFLITAATILISYDIYNKWHNYKPKKTPPKPHEKNTSEEEGQKNHFMVPQSSYALFEANPKELERLINSEKEMFFDTHFGIFTDDAKEEENQYQKIKVKKEEFKKFIEKATNILAENAKNELSNHEAAKKIDDLILKLPNIFSHKNNHFNDEEILNIQDLPEKRIASIKKW